MKHPASTTALPLITLPTYAFLVEADWSKPVAGGVALALGLAPLAASKVSEWIAATRK